MAEWHVGSTFSGLAKVAIFTTNVDAENQTLINQKCVCGALNRHFCQTRVIGCPFLSTVCCVHVIGLLILQIAQPPFFLVSLFILVKHFAQRIK